MAYKKKPSSVKKDLRSPKYKPRVVEDKRSKEKVREVLKELKELDNTITRSTSAMLDGLSSLQKHLDLINLMRLRIEKGL